MILLLEIGSKNKDGDGDAWQQGIEAGNKSTWSGKEKATMCHNGENWMNPHGVGGLALSYLIRETLHLFSFLGSINIREPFHRNINNICNLHVLSCLFATLQSYPLLFNKISVKQSVSFGQWASVVVSG